MSITLQRMTVEERDLYPQEREGDRHELIDGELFVTPAPIPLHQLVSMELSGSLWIVVRAKNLGRLMTAPIDVYLSPHDLVVPDLAFVSHARLNIIGPKRIDGPPDLIVEILSPSTRRRDLTRKRDLYERHGVQEYWIADPVARTLTVHTLCDGRYEATTWSRVILRSSLLPGLELDVAALFANA
jgi:Uma2 family endonuclease